ncbi:MAG: hypothetical protein HFI92_12940 [Lachnospiraceae bacterium]|nr:hypothetical protein [Lachnospiraceae bacterium]
MLKIEKREYQNKTFRLPLSLVERLNRLAQEKNISVNQLVVILCEYGLENLDSDDT